MTKTPTSCDWVASQVSELMLKDYVDMGVLPAKEVINWRVPGPETIPRPEEGEVVYIVAEPTHTQTNTCTQRGKEGCQSPCTF